MNISHLTAAGSYGVLIVLWSGILLFYVHRLRSPKVSSKLVATLIWILAIDAFRTLFESFYFGAWYTSLAGVFPPEVHATLVQPLWILVPKMLNIVAAGLVFAILIRRWIPEEEAELQRHQDQVLRLEEHTAQLRTVNDTLTSEAAERRRAEQRLKGDEQLLRRMLELQEKERRMVAYDIHDGFVQDIVGAHMQVEALHVSRHLQNNEAALEPVMTLLKKAISEGRRMIRDLRPMVLDESGVVEAIKHLVADDKKQNDFTITFGHDIQFDRLEPVLEGAIFRIIQEALNNVKRHGQTDHASVQLTQDNGSLLVEVQDQGAGFELEKVSPDRFGLRGIRERARLFDGNASIESTPGKGTTVRVQLPIPTQSFGGALA